MPSPTRLPRPPPILPLACPHPSRQRPYPFLHSSPPLHHLPLAAGMVVVADGGFSDGGHGGGGAMELSRPEFLWLELPRPELSQWSKGGPTTLAVGGGPTVEHRRIGGLPRCGGSQISLLWLPYRGRDPVTSRLPPR
ncbi:unnamed protein product [Urochloa humidicola]